MDLQTPKLTEAESSLMLGLVVNTASFLETRGAVMHFKGAELENYTLRELAVMVKLIGSDRYQGTGIHSSMDAYLHNNSYRPRAINIRDKMVLEIINKCVTLSFSTPITDLEKLGAPKEIVDLVKVALYKNRDEDE